MESMFINATEVRRDWSSVMENAVRIKPQFIKRTRDRMILTDLSLFDSILSVYKFTAVKYIEKDNSITLSLNEIDLIENAPNEEEAKRLLGKAILNYAEDFYNEFPIWSTAPNRKIHVPYVIKALIINDACKIGAMIECRPGRS